LKPNLHLSRRFDLFDVHLDTVAPNSLKPSWFIPTHGGLSEDTGSIVDFSNSFTFALCGGISPNITPSLDLLTTLETRRKPNLSRAGTILLRNSSSINRDQLSWSQQQIAQLVQSGNNLLRK
jgi:hypothetical protein